MNSKSDVTDTLYTYCLCFTEINVFLRKKVLTLMTHGEKCIFRQTKISCTLSYSNISVSTMHTEILQTPTPVAKWENNM